MDIEQVRQEVLLSDEFQVRLGIAHRIWPKRLPDGAASGYY